MSVDSRCSLCAWLLLRNSKMMNDSAISVLAPFGEWHRCQVKHSFSWVQKLQSCKHFAKARETTLELFFFLAQYLFFFTALMHAQKMIEEKLHVHENLIQFTEYFSRLGGSEEATLVSILN